MTELEQYIQWYFGVVNDEDLHLISSMFNLTILKKYCKINGNQTRPKEFYVYLF